MGPLNANAGLHLMYACMHVRMRVCIYVCVGFGGPRLLKMGGDP